jgi:hypothetical protein
MRALAAMSAALALAVGVALGAAGWNITGVGDALAAAKNLVTGKQIKDGSVQSRDLSRAVRSALSASPAAGPGLQGPAGVGLPGRDGASPPCLLEPRQCRGLDGSAAAQGAPGPVNRARLVNEGCGDGRLGVTLSFEFLETGSVPQQLCDGARGPAGQSIVGATGAAGVDGRGFDCAGNEVGAGETPARCPGERGPAGADSTVPGPAGQDGQSPPCLSEPSQCRGAVGPTGPQGLPGRGISAAIHGEVTAGNTLVPVAGVAEGCVAVASASGNTPRAFSTEVGVGTVRVYGTGKFDLIVSCP